LKLAPSAAIRSCPARHWPPGAPGGRGPWLSYVSFPHRIPTTHRQQHMRDPATLAPRPAGTQPPADAALTSDNPLPGMTSPSQTPRTARAAQPPRHQPPLDHARNNAYRDHRCLRAPARPSRHLGQEKDGRAAAYPNLITVASHTKKGNPAGPPSRPSSPQTTLARRYLLITKVAGHWSALTWSRGPVAERGGGGCMTCCICTHVRCLMPKPWPMHECRRLTGCWITTSIALVRRPGTCGTTGAGSATPGFRSARTRR
jgi:hypothetical protein